ncbi:MAG: flagellar hook-basal body complex protein FliE [Porphyrobacter sp.]|nr:flagellar hook-basal body complex protein FliE [Porphyrobacter sp.]
MTPLSAAGGVGSVEQIMQMRQQLLERSQLLQELHRATGPDDARAAASEGGGFADTLRGALDAVNGKQAEASAMSEGYERGQVTDIASVMLARQEAGIAFEATLQVRNKLLSAYQDIMRMGV